MGATGVQCPAGHQGAPAGEEQRRAHGGSLCTGPHFTHVLVSSPHGPVPVVPTAQGRKRRRYQFAVLKAHTPRAQQNQGSGETHSPCFGGQACETGLF